VAREYHQEHCERAKIGKEESELDDPLSKAGEEGGIQAAPIIAVIGGYCCCYYRVFDIIHIIAAE